MQAIERRTRRDGRRGGKRAVAAVFTAAALVLGFALAGPVAGGEGEGSSKQGKFLFRSKCKECHWPDREGGEVTPITFTQQQWKDFFDKNKHKRKKDVWGEKFTAEELVHIRTYLIEHASDSPQPETCG